MVTNHLTVENIIELNRVLVNQFGDGPAGVKDQGTLEFIVDKASISKDLYKEATILLYEINSLLIQLLVLILNSPYVLFVSILS